MFVLMQVVGGGLALGLIKVLYPDSQLASTGSREVDG